MIDAKGLLDQLMGGNATSLKSAGQNLNNRFGPGAGGGAFAGGAVAGGVLGLLLGNKKVQKMAGGALGYGGAAVVGAIAMRAYQNYQQGRAAQTAAPLTPAEVAQVPVSALPHAKPAADGSPFELVLVQAMVGAAKADGHIDAEEQRKLFSEVERLGLDAESKAYVFDLLTKPVDLSQITNAVVTPEQGAEVYVASRMAIDPDEPAERAYLDALATRLRLPAELREHLEKQAGG